MFLFWMVLRWIWIRVGRSLKINVAMFDGFCVLLGPPSRARVAHLLVSVHACGDYDTVGVNCYKVTTF